MYRILRPGTGTQEPGRQPVKRALGGLVEPCEPLPVPVPLQAEHKKGKHRRLLLSLEFCYINVSVSKKVYIFS